MLKAFSYFAVVVVASVSALAQTPTPTPSPLPVYKITDLGEFGASAINERGQVVGGTFDLYSEPVVFSGPTPVVLPTSTIFPEGASDINNNGVIVGAGGYGGYMWQPGEDDLDGTVGTYSAIDNIPYGINDLGVVVGTRLNGSNDEAYYYDGSYTAYSSLLGGHDDWAQGINEAGYIVGNSNLTGDNEGHAVCFNCSTMDLGGTGGSYTTAMAINNYNNVVGGGYTSGDTSISGFFYNGTLTAIPPFSGDTDSWAWSLNDSDIVVGDSSPDGYYTARAIRWTARNGTEDLTSLIESGEDWNLEGALAINNCGQIVGIGTLDSDLRGFLLSPSFTAMVFEPDPLTTAHDTNPHIVPSSTFALNGERHCVELHDLDGDGYLDGTYATTYLTPTQTYEASNSFVYYRDEVGFEEASAYYYVDEAARYVRNTLGMTEAFGGDPIGLQVHETGFANAEAHPESRSIEFGIRDGRNYAEDAEIVFHEASHILLDDLQSGFGGSDEAGAIKEGFGDYFAVSRFLSYGPYADGQVAKWIFVDSVTPEDGHRSVNSLKKYHNLLTDDIEPNAGIRKYRNSLIWSATLWDLYGLLGRERATSLFLKAVKAIPSSSPTFLVMALGMLSANYDASPDGWDGADQSDIRDIFINHEIIPRIASVNLAGGSVLGGHRIAASVHLVSKAPAGGLTVNLESSDEAAVVPSTVTVPAGRYSVGFYVTTDSVVDPVEAEITASIYPESEIEQASSPVSLEVRPSGTTYETVNDGNWNDPDTWGGDLVPGDGDRVTISKTVTLDADATIGISGATSSDAAITMESGGSLTVASGKTLVVRGDIILDNAPLTMEAGSTLQFDSTQSSSPGDTRYFLQIGADHNQADAKLFVNGEEDNRCRIESLTTDGALPGAISDGEFLQGGKMDVSYADFVSIGDDDVPAMQVAITYNSGFELDHVVFDGGGKLQTTYGIGDEATFTLHNVTFKNTQGDQAASIYSPNALSSGAREVTDCVFDKEVQFYPPVDFAITDTVFGGAFDVTDGAWALFEHNLTLLDGEARRIPADTSNNYWIVTGGSTYYPDFLQVGSYVRDVTLDGEIFEVDGESNEGDGVLLGSPGGPVTITIKNSLVLPDSTGDTSASLFTALGNSDVTLVAEHNTFMAGTRGAIVGQSYAGHAGMISSFKSNLIWDTSARTYKLWDFGTDDTVSNLVTSANLDYNGGYNVLTGSNGSGYNHLEFSSGSPGAHDVSGNPNFVDSSRNMAAWDDHLGGAGSVANAIGELMKKNDPDGYNSDYNIEDLIDYVRAGFAPQNSSYLGTAHDSTDIGAVQVP